MIFQTRFHLHLNTLTVVDSQIETFFVLVGFSFFEGFLKGQRIMSILRLKTKNFEFFFENKNLPHRVSFLILELFLLSLILIIDPHSTHRLTVTFWKSKKKTFFLDIRKLVKKSLSFYLPKSHFVSEKKKSRNFFQLRNLPRMVSFLTLGTCLHSFKHITVPNLYNRLTKIFLKIEQPWFWSTWNP